MDSDFRRTIVQISSLLLSVALLILANGLQTTLLGVRAGIEGISTETVGLIMSAFFAGYAGGCRYVPALIGRIGHVRAFAALTSIVSVIALLHALFPVAWAWIALRMFHGCCFAGLLLIVESWLNGCTDRQYRGRVLAVYSIVFFAAWSASQLLLTLAPPSGFVLFCLVSILLSVALVPVTVSQATLPGGGEAPVKLRLKQLYDISPLGLAGVIAAGLGMSAFFGMGPSFGHDIGLENRSISLFMACTFLGGLTLQWPIGWLSDRIDRGAVIALVSGVHCLICFLFVIGLEAAPGFLWFLSFIFGGFGIPIYSVCVAYINDQLEKEALVSAAGGLLFVYGISAAVSPVLAGQFMGRIGPAGLFWFIGGIQGLFVGFCVWRLLVRPGVPERIRGGFVVLPRTTSALLHLDKRPKPKRGSPKKRAKPSG